MILENMVKAVKELPQGNLESVRQYIITNYPFTMKVLQNMDRDYMKPKRRKGFNLVVRETKKYGRRLYGRLSYNGKTLPTTFNTYTDNPEEAEYYLIKNKEKLIRNYLFRKDKKMFTYLETFYEDQTDLSERVRKDCQNRINSNFIPFLKQEKITNFDQVTKRVLIKFQETLLKIGIDNEKSDKRKRTIPIKPQTVNNNINMLRRVFNQLEKTKK